MSYNQIKEVRSVPRGLGSFGDIVLILQDGSRLEIRSIPSFRETENYILEMMDLRASKSSSHNVKGFAA